jgi:hypothetical protein
MDSLWSGVIIDEVLKSYEERLQFRKRSRPRFPRPGPNGPFREARALPAIQDHELSNFLKILIALANTAGQALQSDIFARCESEEEFQESLRNRLRQNPEIGSDLEEHPHVGRGISDLSFRGISLELKFSDKPIGHDDVGDFLPQATAYVSPADRRFGFLIVLDASVKTEAPGSAANDIFLHEVLPSAAGLPLLVGVVIMRANLPKPSTL